MRVKVLKGTKKKEFTVILPVDIEVSDLSEEIQNAIAELGKLGLVREKELNQNKDKKILKALDEQNAYLEKLTIEFNEGIDLS